MQSFGNKSQKTKIVHTMYSSLPKTNNYVSLEYRNYKIIFTGLLFGIENSIFLGGRCDLNVFA
jgi:hypothetical protein